MVDCTALEDYERAACIPLDSGEGLLVAACQVHTPYGLQGDVTPVLSLELVTCSFIALFTELLLDKILEQVYN